MRTLFFGFSGSGVTMNLMKLTIVGGLLFCLLTIIYRLTFHPLASYPGPLLARVTDWHNWYHAAKGDRHLEVHRQHQKYGSIVRFRPNSLSINTPTAVESIYASRKPQIVKSDWYRFIQFSARGNVSTLTAVDSNRHATKRRLLSHAFSDQALRDMEPRVESQVGKWLHHLGQAASINPEKSVDIGLWSSYLMFDTLADLCFGKPFGVMESSEKRFLINLVPHATRSWYTLGYHPLTQILRRVLFKTPIGKVLGGESFKNNAKFRMFCSEALKERRQAETWSKQGQKPIQKDFFHYLLNARDPATGRGYAKGELESESALLIVAGSDTTSAVLAACFFYLVHNPASLSKLTDEIRSTFPTLEAIRYPNSNSTLATLPYLRACINESLRMTPPSPGHLPREILPGASISIDNKVYPPGTIIGTSAYAMHNDDRYFLEASQFLPERWILPADDDNDENDRNQESPTAMATPSAFIPFSAGPRGCIGKQLAYMELSLALAKVLWMYDLRAKPGNTLGQGGPGQGRGRERKGEFQVRDVFVVDREGPVVQLVNRTIG